MAPDMREVAESWEARGQGRKGEEGRGVGGPQSSCCGTEPATGKGSRSDGACILVAV